MSFNTSLSGINAANANLNVTANNIANVNTTGFKESRAEFADLFSNSAYGLSRNAIGSGVKLSNVAQQFSQGNIDPTGRSLDMAIDGEGFFTLNKNGMQLYSRAGNFQTDANGFVGIGLGFGKLRLILRKGGLRLGEALGEGARMLPALGRLVEIGGQKALRLDADLLQQLQPTRRAGGEHQMLLLRPRHRVEALT